ITAIIHRPTVRLTSQYLLLSTRPGPSTRHTGKSADHSTELPTGHRLHVRSPVLARGADPYALTTTSLVVAHMRAGAHSEAIAVADDLIEKANTIANPWAVSYALMI